MMAYRPGSLHWSLGAGSSTSGSKWPEGFDWGVAMPVPMDGLNDAGLDSPSPRDCPLRPMRFLERLSLLQVVHGTETGN
jgi:hypothetical protein